MFLHPILTFVLSACPQEPPITITAADPRVSPGAVSRIERETKDSARELRRVFPRFSSSAVRILVHSDMGSLGPEVSAALHPSTPGVTLLDRHEIHLVLSNMRHVETGSSRPVVLHELAHEALSQFAGRFASRVPRWVHEGLAQHLAGDTVLGGREEDLVWRIASRQLLPFSDLERDFPRDEVGLSLAYSQSYSFVSWIAREHGIDSILEAVRRIDEGTDFLSALVNVTRRTSLELQQGWEQYLRSGSGARSRVLLENCFSFSMILALPLAALAMIRRIGSDSRAKKRMERARLEQARIPRDRLGRPSPLSDDAATGGADSEETPR
ncbi:MAG: hypothetical protein Fur0037_00010 [Planctomycetota bacterium]